MKTTVKRLRGIVREAIAPKKGGKRPTAGELKAWQEQGKALANHVADVLNSFGQVSRDWDNIVIKGAVTGHDDPGVSDVLRRVASEIAVVCELQGTTVQVKKDEGRFIVAAVERPYFAFYVYPPFNGIREELADAIRISVDTSGKKPNHNPSWAH